MLILLISACGKTGALYLPEDEPAAAGQKMPEQSPVLNNEEADRGSL